MVFYILITIFLTPRCLPLERGSQAMQQVRHRARAGPRAALLADGLAGVEPSPATHAILTVLKAGEGVFQTLSLTKTVVHVHRGAQPLFHALFWRQNTV